MSNTEAEYNAKELTGSSTTTLPAASVAPTLAARLAKLRLAAGLCIETWRYEPGESLIGVITSSQRAVGIYGENFQLLIKDEDGRVTAAWLTPWLRDNLRVQGADIGDLVAITFLGKKQSPTGRTCNSYSIAVDKTGIDKKEG
jgi:hypothetical protein